MRKKHLLILVLLSGLLFFLKLGSFSLYDAAETTYGEFVKNILNTGDWITLHYNGQIIFDKPPLYYWLAAALSMLIGFNEWAMRCWAALAGILTVVTTYRLGKVLYNERTGFLSGIIVMTAFQFLIQSRIAELDIVLTLFIYLAIFCFYCGYISNQRKYYLLAYFPMALAILIKGVLGVALPALAIFLFLLFKKELGKIKDFYPVWGGVIIALIGLPWYVIEYLRHGRVFLDFALGFLFLSRFQGVVSGHTGPWYYYLPALLLGFAPWSHFLPYSLWNTFKHWKKDPELLISCFIIPAFIIFSAARTKLPNYVLPLYPFLAITIGKLWDDFLDNNKPATERRGFLISNLLLIMIVALIIFGFVIVGHSNYPAQYQIFIPGLLVLAVILAGGSLISIILFFLRAYAASFYSIPAMVFLIVLVLILQVLPQVELFKGAKPLGAEIRTVIRPGESIAVYDVGNRPSVVLHSPRPVIFLESDSALASFLIKHQGYAFTTVDKYEKIKKLLPKTVKILDIKGDLLVVYNR